MRGFPCIEFRTIIGESQRRTSAQQYKFVAIRCKNMKTGGGWFRDRGLCPPPTHLRKYVAMWRDNRSQRGMEEKSLRKPHIIAPLPPMSPSRGPRFFSLPMSIHRSLPSTRSMPNISVSDVWPTLSSGVTRLFSPSSRYDFEHALTHSKTNVLVRCGEHACIACL